MKKGLTEIVFILDRSGSMAGMEADTIGGFNALIEKQKREEGMALVTTVLFSTDFTTLHDRVPLDGVQPMTRRDYCVGGCTALLDAVGETVQRIGTIHRYAREEDVPEHTMVVITTDGMENASRRHTLAAVKEMIGRMQTAHDWEFLFLGANMDAVSTAEGLGIRADRAATYACDSEGTRANFAAIDAAMCCVRASAPMEEDWRQAIEEDMKRRRGR